MEGDDTDPFFLPAGRTGCLLIHGFTATPFDMRFFGEHLHAAGLTVNAVRLAGHATSADDMERVSWRDWVCSVRDGLATLAASTDRRVVVGQSLGSLLALDLAADHPDDVHAVVPISTALMTSSLLLNQLGPLFSWVPTILPRGWRYWAKGSSDVADPDARAAAKTYREVPLRAVGELTQFQQYVRPKLRAVRQPALAIHSRQDHTCPVENLEILERELAGDVQSLMLENSYHVVSIDRDRELVADAISTFIASLP